MGKVISYRASKIITNTKYVKQNAKGLHLFIKKKKTGKKYEMEKKIDFNTSLGIQCREDCLKFR